MKCLNITFVAAPQYRQLLLETIPRAKKRVIIHAMDIRWGTKLEDLVDELHAAAQRGIEVRIVGDIYTKFQARLPFARAKGFNWSNIMQVNERLRSAGAHVVYTGKIAANPYKNRTHSKVLIIDDTVYTFGGVNITDESFGNKDYMLRIADAQLANRLYRLVQELENDPPEPLPDLREPLDAHTTLLFDGGTPGISAIYETACDVVATARKIYFVSQMSPSGALAKLITKTDNTCYFIRARQTVPPDSLALKFDQLRYGIVNHYKRPAYIHAKFILTEDRDGSKHIISGSNNFSWRGVAFGTKEIAVHSTDPVLWQTFYDFIQAEIA